jgi:hypothetical protein
MTTTGQDELSPPALWVSTLPPKMPTKSTASQIATRVMPPQNERSPARAPTADVAWCLE